MVGNVKLVNSTISFKGKGNILYCKDEDIKLVNSQITFNGSNSIIFLCKNRHNYILNVSINHNSVLYRGTNNYINGKLNIIISEQKNVIIGNECLFSFECWIRTADPHLIYDSKTKNRINNSKSIYLGDHIWIGQHSFILKGTKIGSGSIVGGMSVVSGKILDSNTSYAGNPVRKIRESVFFTSDCVHLYKDEEAKKSSMFKDDKYIYEDKKEEIFTFEKIESDLDKLYTTDKKLDYIIENLQMNRNHNRFYVKNESIRKNNSISNIAMSIYRLLKNKFNN